MLENFIFLGFKIMCSSPYKIHLGAQIYSRFYILLKVLTLLKTASLLFMTCKSCHYPITIVLRHIGQSDIHKIFHQILPIFVTFILVEN